MIKLFTMEQVADLLHQNDSFGLDETGGFYYFYLKGTKYTPYRAEADFTACAKLDDVDAYDSVDDIYNQEALTYPAFWKVCSEIVDKANSHLLDLEAERKHDAFMEAMEAELEDREVPYGVVFDLLYVGYDDSDFYYTYVEDVLPEDAGDDNFDWDTAAMVFTDDHWDHIESLMEKYQNQ